MNLQDKLNAVITTETISQAFVDGRALAEAGAVATVQYVWWQAVMTATITATIATVAICFGIYLFRTINSRCCGERDMFPNYMALIGSLCFAALMLGICADYAPRIANPQGYIIYIAIKGDGQ